MSLRTAAIAYAVTVGALVAYNVRWRHLKKAILGGHKAQKLPVVVVKGNKGGAKNKSHVPIVLLHGMWHDPSYFARLQQLLSENGYSSYAVSLLPGERLLPGGSQKEIVADLEKTLADIAGDQYILLGHSQGGLVVQSALQNSKMIREATVGVVLLGTYPLGKTLPIGAMLKKPNNMYNDIGYAWICMFGKLMNVRYTKRIFLMPTTDETTPEMSRYIQQLLNAPSDGLITISHFPAHVVPLQTPALVLGAAGDAIYPPELLTKDFDKRFPINTTHVVAKDQAHCFVDPGWEISMGEPLLAWLDQLVD